MQPNTLIAIGGQTVDASMVSVPPNRNFREAWQLSGDVISVDMTKAREIHRDNLRMERAPLLEALDVKYMRALEEGGDTAAVVAEKQVLRDITADPRIEAASTPEELSALTLSALLG